MATCRHFPILRATVRLVEFLGSNQIPLTATESTARNILLLSNTLFEAYRHPRHTLIGHKKAHRLRLWALWLYFFAAFFSLRLCREINLRVSSAACSNCTHSLDNRGWFGGDRFHLREFYDQLFNLALFVRLGKDRLCHGSSFAQRWAEGKPCFQIESRHADGSDKCDDPLLSH